MNPAPESVTARGEDTREALIAAGMRVFGRDGFEAASTRAIADAAGVNQALIGYHFRNKDGLYRAVFEHIAQQLERRVGPLLAAASADFGARPASPAGTRAQRAQARERLLAIVDAMAGILAREESAAWARLILAEQQSPSEAFTVIYAGFMGPALELIALLVARIRGRDPDATQTRLIVVAILGQALVFRAARAGVLRHLGWADIGEAQFALVRAQLRRNVTALLDQE